MKNEPVFFLEENLCDLHIFFQGFNKIMLNVVRFDQLIEFYVCCSCI